MERGGLGRKQIVTAVMHTNGGKALAGHNIYHFSPLKKKPFQMGCIFDALQFLFWTLFAVIAVSAHLFTSRAIGHP